MVKYWIGVASWNHVQRGASEGFAQVCHGKGKPLHRMKPGDWFAYYSPSTEMKGGRSLQQFTSIGRVISKEPYQVTMTADFKPFRVDIDYVDCVPAPIRPLLSKLTFTSTAKHWGMQFRRGHFSISKEDFEMIALAMNVDVENSVNEQKSSSS